MGEHAGLSLVRNLRPALNPSIPVYRGRHAANLGQEQPLVLPPEVSSFQVEVCICPVNGVSIESLALSAAVSTYVGESSVGEGHPAVNFTVSNIWKEGEVGRGTNVRPDNTQSPYSNHGLHTRVVWTVHCNQLPPKVAASALTLSSNVLHHIRLITLNVFPSQWDKESNSHVRGAPIASAYLQLETLQRAAKGMSDGTLALATLTRASAWWHIYCPPESHPELSHSPASSFQSFSTSLKRSDNAMTALLGQLYSKGSIALPMRATVSISIASAHRLPRNCMLERFLCGYCATYIRPSLRIIDSHTSKTMEYKEYPVRKVPAGAPVEWSMQDRVPVTMTLYGVMASDTRRVRITLYKAMSESAVSRTAHATGPSAEQPGGIDEEQQWVDLSVAELWNLLPEGSQKFECLVEARLKKGEKDTSSDIPGELAVYVAIAQEAAPQ